MLEDRPCLVSRGYPRTCEHENSWTCMSYRLEKIEVAGQRPLETDRDEEAGVRKLSKQLDAFERVELAPILRGVSISPKEGLSDDQPERIDVQTGKQSLEVGRDEDGGIEKLPKQLDALEKKVSCGKRPLDMDEDEEPVDRKLSKQTDALEMVEMADMVPTLPGISMPPADQSSSQRQAGDTSDSSSLIHPIGRDNSISCLIRCSRSDYGSIASLNRSFRSLVRSGELYRLRRHNDVVEYWVYFSCQLLEWEAFDPARRRWMRLPTMNTNEFFVFSDKESLAVGTELLVFGKEVMSHVIYRYSLLTNTWSSGMSMNAPRCLFGSASLGEIAILAGGCDSQGNILSSAELYNSETGIWETLPSMNKPRKMCSAVFMDKKFYVIGGIGGSDSKLLMCGEEYNLKTRTWREIPNMSNVRGGAARENGAQPTTEAPPLIAVVDNELYAADYADMEVRKYDKDRIEWITVGTLPERADSMNGWGLAFRACGDRLIVIGGPRGMGDGFIEINSWCPSEGPPQWNVLGRKQSGSFVYNCTVMGC